MHYAQNTAVVNLHQNKDHLTAHVFGAPHHSMGYSIALKIQKFTRRQIAVPVVRYWNITLFTRTTMCSGDPLLERERFVTRTVPIFVVA